MQKQSEFTQAQIDKALQAMADEEKNYLDQQGYINPFRRPGITAKNLAFACDLIKEGTTASGGLKPDTPAAKRLLKQLVADGKVDSIGAHRTLHIGSATTECFALAGFEDRLLQAKELFYQEAEKKNAPKP